MQENARKRNKMNPKKESVQVDNFYTSKFLHIHVRPDTVMSTERRYIIKPLKIQGKSIAETTKN